jgi:hypothetical protein
MEKKPKHKDIEKYGYMLNYSPSENNWYASMETDKSDAWYKWIEAEQKFDLIVSYHVPNDIILNAPYLKGAS